MNMADQYRVKAPVVKVSIGSLEGNRVARILSAGRIVPDGVAEESLKQLEQRGLIVKATAGRASTGGSAESDPAGDDASDTEDEKTAAEKPAGRASSSKK